MKGGKKGKIGRKGEEAIIQVLQGDRSLISEQFLFLGALFWDMVRKSMRHEQIALLNRIRRKDHPDQPSRRFRA